MISFPLIGLMRHDLNEQSHFGYTSMELNWPNFDTAIWPDFEPDGGFLKLIYQWNVQQINLINFN